MVTVFGHSSQQATSAHRDYNGVRSKAQLVGDFSGNGSLTGDGARVVERGYDQRPRGGGVFLCKF